MSAPGTRVRRLYRAGREYNPDTQGRRLLGSEFWLIGFGVEATVLSPIELAKEIGAEAETLAKAYRRFVPKARNTPGEERR